MYEFSKVLLKLGIPSKYPIKKNMSLTLSRQEIQLIKSISPNPNAVILNKNFSRSFEPFKIKEIFSKTLKKPVEITFDKKVYRKGETYTACINFTNPFKKDVRVVYYGWFKKINETLGIEHYFSEEIIVKKGEDRKCFSFEMPSMPPGKYKAEAFYYLTDHPEIHYYAESEVFEVED